MPACRIAVVGTCNASILANCLRVLRPDDDVRAVLADQLESTDKSLQLAEFDWVFAVANAHELGALKKLSECKRVLSWPNLVFFGFHPDITYFGIDDKPVRSA